MNNHYSLLGVDIYSSKEQIKKAYYQLAKQYHPDNNKDKNASTKFKEIKTAYDWLKNNHVQQKKIEQPKVEPFTINIGSMNTAFSSFSQGIGRNGFKETTNIIEINGGFNIQCKLCKEYFILTYDPYNSLIKAHNISDCARFYIGIPRPVKCYELDRKFTEIPSPTIETYDPSYRSRNPTVGVADFRSAVKGVYISDEEIKKKEEDFWSTSDPNKIHMAVWRGFMWVVLGILVLILIWTLNK